MRNISISAHHHRSFSMSDLLVKEEKNAIIADIFRQLSAPRKSISSRFFYDENGSALFEEITRLQEYYPSRTEKSLLKQNAKAILPEAGQLDIIELGSGDCSKISAILDTMPRHLLRSICYIPVDVSKTALLKAAKALTKEYPGITINAMRADFLKHLEQLPGYQQRLITFFGSTLGNLMPSEAHEFLLNVRTHMKTGDKFVLGLDMVKDPEILNKAYNDAKGITAAFNLNILNVVNKIAGTNFNTHSFEHLAFYNPEKMRVEMHLKALENVTIASRSFPSVIKVKKGETIHTEHSHKYTANDISNFAHIMNLQVLQIFTDKHNWFSLAVFG